MSDRPTPVTDAYCLRAIGFPTGYEWREFARNLERQRDEARELARELRDALKKQQGFILTLINTHPTSLFSRSQNQVNTALNKAKEVLP